MKKLSHPVAIVLLAALASSCASGSGTTGLGPGTASRVTPAPSAGGAGSGASPASAVPQAVVDEHWPREASSGGDHVTVYQPQVDAWEGSLLRAHAAVAVKTGDAKTPPTFGVAWVTVRTEVDRDTRLVTLRNGLITRADFPSSPGKQDAYARTIEEAVLHETVIGLDRLEAALAIHQKATAIVLAGTYEINTEEEGVDVTPGQRFTLNYGVSQYVPAGPGLAELGVLGYSQWQVTQDSGADVSQFNQNQDQVHAIGAQIGYAIPQWRLAVTAQYLYEYYAEARFRGQVATLSVAYQF